jgi:hypothetical protein
MDMANGARKGGTKKTNSSSNESLYKYGSVALVILASIFLFFAQSAYWFNHTIFNQKNFSTITTENLLSESSRDAIAASIVDKALEDKPIAKRVAGERIESLISGLLGSDLSNQAIKTLTNKVYAYATSSDRKDIAIDLTPIKQPISAIIALSNSDNAGQASERLNQIPDQIVLVNSDTFPDVSGYVKLMLWLGPLLWIGTFVSYGLYIYIGRANYARRVYIAGISVIVVALFGLMTSPFVPPPVAAAVPNINLRPVAENIAVGFLAPFKTQMYYMLFFMVIVLILFSLRFRALALVKLLETKINKKS